MTDKIEYGTMFVVRETKQKRMIEMMDEKTLAYIRWYFRTSAIEEDMVYIDDKKEMFNWLFMGGDEDDLINIMSRYNKNNLEYGQTLMDFVFMKSDTIKLPNGKYACVDIGMVKRAIAERI